MDGTSKDFLAYKLFSARSLWQLIRQRTHCLWNVTLSPGSQNRAFTWHIHPELRSPRVTRERWYHTPSQSPSTGRREARGALVVGRLLSSLPPGSASAEGGDRRLPGSGPPPTPLGDSRDLQT